MRPRAARTFRPCRSPCSHRSGPAWGGRRTASRPRPLDPGALRGGALASAARDRLARAAASGTPRNGLRGASAGAGTCRAARNPASASAARRPAPTGEGTRPRAAAPGRRRTPPTATGSTSVGCARAHRGGHRQRQAGRQLGQPPQLGADQARPELPAGHPNREVRAQPEHRVVPSAADPAQGPIGEVRVLVAQQSPHEVGVDRHLGRGDRCAHRLSLGPLGSGAPGRAPAVPADATGLRRAWRRGPPSQAPGAVHYGGPIRRTDRHRRYR